MDEEPLVQPMRLEDIPRVIEIERQCFPSSWQPGAYQAEVNSSTSHYLVARLRGLAVGFTGAWLIGEEAHITTLAVDPGFQQRGIGTRLLRALIDHAMVNGVNRISLEVREQNLPARRLYSRSGFQEVAYLRGYYRDTGDDAVVMWLKIDRV